MLIDIFAGAGILMGLLFILVAVAVGVIIVFLVMLLFTALIVKVGIFLRNLDRNA